MRHSQPLPDALPLSHSQQEGTIPTVAVLYRTAAMSRSIEEALLRLNIPYHVVGG